MSNSNVLFKEHLVTQKLRESIKNQKGCCLWLTGLSGSGKTTIANKLEYELNKSDVHTYLLDGDNLRSGINNDLGFSKNERSENVRRVGELSKLFVEAGIIVIASLISPFESDRQSVKKKLPDGRWFEIFVDTELEICKKRDPKNLYKKALNNEIKEFTGISSPYEVPINPALRISNNDDDSISENVTQIINLLKVKNIIT